MDIRTVPIVSGQTSGQLVNGAGRLFVHTITETTGAATAKYTLYDGTGVSGTLLVPVTLAANESSRDYFGKHGIPFLTGVYIEVVSGSVQGALVVQLCDPREVDTIPVVIALSPADLSFMANQGVA